MKKIKQLKKNASTKKGIQLIDEIRQSIETKDKIICKALNKRPVFLTKYLESTNGRRDQTRRKQVFFPGVELIRCATTENISENPQGIEILGLTANGEKIGVHIREESNTHGNKRLYLISTFRGNQEDR
jgi:hypothetical protein